MESSISIILHLYLVALVVLVSSSPSHSSMAPSVSSLEKTRRRCHDEEKAALLQFKHSFASTNECYNGDWSDVFHQKRKLESWKEGGDCCSWEGVECGDDHHHVVGLHLSGSCLYGSVNSSNALFTLTHLQRLDLSYNDFNYSHIPSAIGNLSSLTHLNLSGSNFSGQIPQQHLSNITTMVSLDLSSYSELELHSLKGLVQHMSNLKHLHLSRVDLSSSAPHHDFLSNFSSLQSLHLSSCELRGGFPAAIFNLPNIKMLDLSGNPDLRGYLPSFRSGSPLKSLRLSHTSFGGVLPPSIGNLASLEELDIGICSFTGDLPTSLGNLTQLVSLGANNFTPDTLDTSSLSWIGKLTKLTDLFLKGLDLTGEIPSSLINLTRLTNLYMPYNRISGPIPSWIMTLPQLNSIVLSHNQLSGHIPPNFNHLIQHLDLCYNNLEGWLVTASELRILILRSNSFHGVINDDFGFSNIQVIDLSNNNFRGKLPSMFIDAPNPMRALNVSRPLEYMEQDLYPPSYWNSEEFGSFDYSLTMHNKGLEMNYLKIPNIFCGIDFSSNNFEGQIPETFGYLAGLQLLNLSRNDLSGQIPSSFTNLTSLESLDLSQNQLSGHIPMELTKLTPLSSLNVSFNNLSGPIPQGNQFCTYDAKSYEGNPGLFIETWNKQCGNARSSPQLKQQPPPATFDGGDDDVDSEYEFRMKWIIILIGFVSGLVGGVIVGNEFTTRKHDWFVKTFARKRRG
ncbi:hypothetical protein DM860_016444 [Cuscuta australis]|uniref:Leucine-rich repeat-containing N-terminal plant-type domain-containing protein n=1 Tax=Cuscuta australis TaxID=267555 RepID=A0A328DHU2_9ASTE|nr:hypothetical protein DM860_016444 [Cuscuta australis]